VAADPSAAHASRKTRPVECRSDRTLKGLATEAGAVVGHDGDRGRDDVDDLACGLVGEFELTAVLSEVVDAEDAFGFCDGGVQAGERVGAAAGRGDRDGQAVGSLTASGWSSASGKRWLSGSSAPFCLMRSTR
jgi:hypothetical protein